MIEMLHLKWCAWLWQRISDWDWV